MTSKPPSESEGPPPDKAAPMERSIDFGAHLMREARKKVKESARHQAWKERERAEEKRLAALPEDAPRQSVVFTERPGPVQRPERPRRSLRAKLLLLVLSFLGSLVALEVGARLFVREPEQLRGRS